MLRAKDGCQPKVFKASVTYYLEDEPDPTCFQVVITAPAADLELFLLPYIEKQADLQIEILNIIQPANMTNLKWLDYLIQHQQGDTPDEEINCWTEQ